MTIKSGAAPVAKRRVLISILRVASHFSVDRNAPRSELLSLDSIEANDDRWAKQRHDDGKVTLWVEVQ